MYDQKKGGRTLGNARVSCPPGWSFDAAIRANVRTEKRTAITRASGGRGSLSRGAYRRGQMAGQHVSGPQAVTMGGITPRSASEAWHNQRKPLIG
jgi:hypothetical protein